MTTIEEYTDNLIALEAAAEDGDIEYLGAERVRTSRTGVPLRLWVRG